MSAVDAGRRSGAEEFSSAPADPGRGHPVRNALLVVVPLTAVVGILAWSGALHPNVSVVVDTNSLEATPQALVVDLELHNRAGRPVDVVDIGADRPGMVVQEVLIGDGRELVIPHLEPFEPAEIAGGGTRRASIVYRITGCEAALGSTPKLPIVFRSELGVHHTAVVAPADTIDGPLPLRFVLERLIPEKSIALIAACHDSSNVVPESIEPAPTTEEPG